MTTEQLIEAYFLNELNANEVEMLKERLQSDSSAKSEFIFQLELSQVLHDNEKKKIKQRLRLLDHQNSSLKIKWWAVAASIAVLFAMAWAFGFFSINQQNDQLYSEYFQAYPNVIAPLERSNNSNISALQKEAFQLYERENYDKASLAFQKLYTQKQEEYAHFYLIISTMGNKEYTKAINLYKQKENWESNEFELAAKWYAALAYLKLNDENQSINLLKEIQVSNHPLSISAEKLLVELE